MGGSVAHAIMGESAENRGLVIAPQKAEVLLACVLGDRCESNGEFFRRMAVGQINRGGTIESGIEFAGIGLGSLTSSEVQPSEGPSYLTDMFCWAGTGKKECLSLFLSNDAASLNGAVIDASPDNASECNGAATTFGQSAGTFDYLIKFDEIRYGNGDAVKVVTCSGVAAEFVGLTTSVLQSEVVVNAHRGMAAYDVKYYGGLYCCRR